MQGLFPEQADLLLDIARRILCFVNQHYRNTVFNRITLATGLADYLIILFEYVALAGRARHYIDKFFVNHFGPPNL